jgi:predicted dehydrogenase
MSVDECARMIAACDKAKVRLMIAYRIQYEPRHRLLQGWVRGGKALGVVKLVQLENAQAQSKSHSEQWRLKRAQGGYGALGDIGIYCANTARFLLGEEPIEIGATSWSTPGDPRFDETPEAVSWWMRFPSGVIATSVTSYAATGAKRYRVVGTEGWAEMDPAFPYRGLRLRRSHEGADGPIVEELALPDEDQFAIELDHFARCISEGKRPYTPGEEGLQDQRVLDAIMQAATTKRVVSLEAPGGLDVFRGPPPEPRD